jgi:hypothetical protein
MTPQKLLVLVVLLSLASLLLAKACEVWLRVWRSK